MTALAADALKPLYDVMRDPERASEWVRCVVRRRGADGWEKLTASPVRLRSGDAVKLVETQGARERTDVVPLEHWPERLSLLLAEPVDRIHLLTHEADWHARLSKRGRWLVSRGKPSAAERAGGPLEHDRRRSYPLPPDHPVARRLFTATGLLSPQGNLRGRFADKYRQVQHYVELLRPLPIWEDARRGGRPVRIVDAGCGKAYMSLALYAYAELQGLEVELVGLDRNEALVNQVRQTAEELGYARASFEVTTIWDYARSAGRERGPLDLLVSLHACDTATDEAIAAGIELDANAIVLAPCCHHELAAQLGDGRTWAPVLAHGVLRGRLADIVTDALRASALEVFGYKAEAIEFVAAEHTAKNLMIRAVRRAPGAAEREKGKARAAYAALAAEWGVKPTLESLLAERWPD